MGFEDGREFGVYSIVLNTRSRKSSTMMESFNIDKN
jgi:hypothetical protein